MSPQQIDLLQRLGLATLESIEAAGETGAPAGVLYAAMMAQGASKNQFDSFMAGLENKGMVSTEGLCYWVTDQGRQFMSTLKAKFATAPEMGLSA